MKISRNQIFFIFFSKRNIKIFVLLSFFLFQPLFAQALSSGGVGGYPANPDPNIPHSESWFIYSLDLGESKEDALLIFNTSDETKTVKLYAVDSVPSNQGNFALAAEDAPKEDLGGWLKLAETFITLEPGESREVPFTIAIPGNADVGEHSGGIIIQKSSLAEALSQTGASIVTRVGIRVYETVPGEIVKKIELDEFAVKLAAPENQKPFYGIDLSVSNKSTVSLTPKVDLEIRGWGKIDYDDFEDISLKKLRLFFTGQEDFPIHFFSGETLAKDWQLLRGQKVSTHWEWLKPKFGYFTFQAKITYEGDNGPQILETAKISVWVVPWAELGVIGGVILLIIILFISRKIFFSGRNWNKYQTKRDDNLPQIAYQSKVSLKRLAKINKIVKPYVIKPDQIILVPLRFLAKQKDTMSKVKEKAPLKKINNKEGY